MSTREKLAAMKEAEARNAMRESEFRQAKNIEGLHRTVEIQAASIMESVETTAQLGGVPVAEYLELLVSTLWAMKQIKDQES